MSDRPDSTPQPPHPEEDVFRQTFLLRLDDPKKVDTFLALGDLLMEYLNELHQWGTSEKEMATTIQLRAAAADLHRVSGYLESVAEERERHSLPAPEDWLALKADKWATKVEKVAASIERALAQC